MAIKSIPKSSVFTIIREVLADKRKIDYLNSRSDYERYGSIYKKSYISRIERGLSDIQISTYHKLIELGLGRQLNISIQSLNNTKRAAHFC